MAKIIRTFLIASLCMQIVSAASIEKVDTFEKMFSEGSISGELRSIYAEENQPSQAVDSTYATAFGGMLKYELAVLNGFNAGVAFRTSQNIGFATRDISVTETYSGNSNLSSSRGTYTQLSEAYVNYKYSDLNIRLGRQVIDTPLSDSDDWSMNSNSFEAYIVTFEYSDFSFMVGNVQNWQGMDAGIDDGWVSAGENGTYLVGVTYSQAFDMSAWYYDISVKGQETRAFFVDTSYNYEFNKNISLNSSLEYLNEKQVNSSGVEADIYGALAELSVYDIAFNIAYNKSLKNTGKRSFSGLGGGTLYTSVNVMIMDVIAQDREVDAFMAMVNYNLFGADIYYAYADFSGGKNSSAIKEHIVEQNIGLDYSMNDRFDLTSVYVIAEDLENYTKSSNDFERFQMMLRYRF